MADGSTQRIAALTWLYGCRVQRVDAPEPTLFAFSLYTREAKQTLLISLRPGSLGVGTVAHRPHGQPATAFVRRLRVLIENARLLEATALVQADVSRAAALELVFERHSEQTRLWCDFHPQKPSLYIVDAQARITGASDEAARRTLFSTGTVRSIHSAATELPHDAGQADSLGTALLRGRAEQAELGLRTLARQRAKAALRRAERKRAAIQGDLARASDAARLRREASVLLCHLGQVARGQASVELVDLEEDPPASVRIALDPALSPEQNAERKFAKARRLARGTNIASERLAEVEAQLFALQRFQTELELLPPAELEQAAERVGLALAAASKEASESRRASPPQHSPYRVFAGTGEARILVGKGAADNDQLTLHVARPQDLWLHARATHGAHVIVPRTRNAPLSQELLLDAAHLAAHFSDARGEPRVEIQHTERRFIRKPKGAAKGAVIVDREKVLLLRLEPTRLARLLASERPP